MRKTILYALLLCLALPMAAQQRESLATRHQTPAAQPSGILDRSKHLVAAALKGWQLSLGAGLEIGGTAPLPMPRSIRKIETYNPLLNLYVEGMAHKTLYGAWGVQTGLRFETKGMKTKAKVKAYHLQLTETATVLNPETGSAESREQSMEGKWTGPVTTEVHHIYLTVPALVTFTTPNERWRMAAGPYVSFLLNGNFSGHVENGYLRTAGKQEAGSSLPHELGENVSITRATYDFSDKLSRFAWGLQAGASFHAYKHLYVNGNLTWGMHSIFPKSFKTLDFALYPIYANLGFSYAF